MDGRQAIVFRDSSGRSAAGSTLIGKSSRWKLLLAAFAIHLFGNGFTLSYGIYTVTFIQNGKPAWLIFYTQIVYAVAFTVAQTWCREVTESWSGNIGYRCMAFTGLIVTMTGMVAAVFTPFYLYPVNLGLLGGIGTCILLTQVDTLISESFETHLGMARALCFIAQSAGQIFAPQLILLLIHSYGGIMTLLINSAMVFQTLPAILYLKNDFVSRRPMSLSRYSDLSRVTSFFNEAQFSRNDMQLVEMNTKSWRSPDDSVKPNQNVVLQQHDTFCDDDDDDDDNPSLTETPPPTPEEKRRNLLGVEILPEIPEENEMSSDSDGENGPHKIRKHFNNDIKRLSVMSDKLDELISRNNTLGPLEINKLRDCNVEDTTIANVETTYNLGASASREFGYQNPNRIRVFGHVRLKRRIMYCGYCINDTFFKPFGMSLAFWRFYPALLLKVSTVLIPIGVTTLTPIFAVTVIKITARESSLLLSLYGFSWMCFLVASPWITSMPKAHLKFVFVGGSFTSLAGLFIMADTKSHAFILIACVLVGLGQGATLVSSEDTLREWIGLRKWSKVRGTLEFLSSIVVAFLGASISYTLTTPMGVKTSFAILTLVQAVICFVWFLVSISNIYFRGNHQTYEISPLSC